MFVVGRYFFKANSEDFSKVHGDNYSVFDNSV